MSPKSQERIVRYDALLGSGATQTKSMLQYVNRMLRDKECQKIVEGAQANGLLDGSAAECDILKNNVGFPPNK